MRALAPEELLPVRCRLSQIASARELRLTGALKSSPPPELILEENNSGRLHGLATSRWLHI
jgi:hypothetical protein